ncbi:stabilizer of axonemal microtubules 1 isoform X1 [Cuculus canorus]|uniref:stabilizer of axonemal microtubules 1 isoform X1 n=1 Tax=Cuculus canorus TaxID=55661 RepID=UPI0023AB5456|nr:stabilizer of axonemal microtubules 1 isoform X1 [Cuculus canorus]XP_053909907.1 stabilizer of axonemal microtubules 1 isoform X1 [Cuculus canorus]
MLSEYMEQYRLYPFTLPRGSFKPKKEYKMARIPMEGISTTKKDYVAHEVLPQKPKPPAKHVKSDEIMDLTSTYKQDYKSYPISQVPPCLPPVTRHIPDTKMNTRTTYKSDYVQWDEPKTEPIKLNDRFCPSEEKFDYRTTVQDDYLYRGPVVTESCKPLNLVQKNKVPFENVTSYRLNYVPHPLEKRYVHQYEKYKATEEPFEGFTTHNTSYKGLAGEPAKLAKPYRVKIHHDLPFSSTTEFREKYQAWPRCPVITKKPDVYHPPLEKMDLCTTTQIDYKYRNGKPAKICRSLPRLKSPGAFNSSSVMKEDYKPWLCKRPKPITHAPQLTCPAEPMDCLTTYQTHYVPHLLRVTKNYKPGWSGPKPHALLDANTTYATSYTPKGVVRCLASYKNPPGYVFEGTDVDGHRLYVPASKSECKVDSEGIRKV